VAILNARHREEEQARARHGRQFVRFQAGGISMLTRRQFERTRRLALELAGIELLERHGELLYRRSRRLGMRDAHDFDVLLDAAEKGDPVAGQRFVGLVTTKFTGFFRHPWHFAVAAEQARWAVHRRNAARLWSAAAATGEEPYSLAMAVMAVFGRADPAVTIRATDIDEEALGVARRGEYGEAALGALGPAQRARFFGEPAGPGRRRIARAVRDYVEFRPLNLVAESWPVQGPFDVIFCRNVVMYLEACHRYAVLERMASLLAPDGLLILDPAEHTGKADHLFTPGTDGVYSRRRVSRPLRDVTPAHGISSR
jgi:chemotaxis protein methyltransferase CheR